MEFFTSRNLVILALVQIGILTASVLGAGAVHKWYKELPTKAPVPLLCRLLAEFGWLGLILPVVWLTLTLRVFLEQREYLRGQVYAVAAGFLVIVLFLLLAYFGVVQPWSQLIYSFD